MIFNKLCLFNGKSIPNRFKLLNSLSVKAHLTSSAVPKNKLQENRILIKCKDKRLDHYLGQTYNKLNKVSLASENWEDNKSIGDYFVVYPNPNGYKSIPCVSLSEINLNENLKKALTSQDVIKLTSLQKEAIDVVGKGDNTILAAETGCGKTFAYLLPIIQELIVKKNQEQNAPRALVLVPTRELAYQVASVAESLANPVGVNVKVLVGGNTKKLMFTSEFSQVDLLIGTPGVIQKLHASRLYRLKDVAFTIMDEADTLMDNSFKNEVATLMRAVPNSQLTLVCATFPKTLPLMFSQEKHFTHITSPLLHKSLSNITQRFSRVRHSAKPHLLLQIAKSAKNSVIVFANRSDICNWITQLLKRNGLECSSIHGKMDHWTRIEQWNSFINGPNNILVCTNSAGKGLDICDVNHVVNYDFPIYAADYIHGIGKVGRLSSPKSCQVSNLITHAQEVRLLQSIELAIRTDGLIPYVDGNITDVFQKKIEERNRGKEL